MSPDGQLLALVGGRNVQIDGENVLNVDVVTLSLIDGTVAPLLDSSVNESEISIAANGEWAAHIEFGNDIETTVYLRPFPDTSATKIPVGPGLAPAFSPDGTEILFVSEDIMISVPIEYVDRVPRLGAAVPLFDVSQYETLLLGRRWEMHPDGERFLLIPKVAPTDDRVVVELNWFEELEDRVPTA